MNGLTFGRTLFPPLAACARSQPQWPCPSETIDRVSVPSIRASFTSTRFSWKGLPSRRTYVDPGHLLQHGEDGRCVERRVLPRRGRIDWRGGRQERGSNTDLACEGGDDRQILLEVRQRHRRRPVASLHHHRASKLNNPSAPRPLPHEPQHPCA